MFKYFLLGFLCLTLMACSSNEEEHMVFSKALSPHFITQDIDLDEGVNFIVEPGAHLIISDGINFNLRGDVLIQGTEEDPIILDPVNPNIGWGTMSLKGEAENLIIEHAIITDGIITSFSTNNSIHNVEFINTQDLNWQSATIRFWFGSVDVRNCFFTGINKAEGILMHDVNQSVIANNRFEFVPDAIELIDGQGGEFFDNIILFSSDDGVDLNGCEDVVIRNNYFEGIGDAAMEIGSENFGRTLNAMVEDNMIVGCTKGIWLKESSTIHAQRDSFIDNQIGVEVVTSPDSIEVSSIILEDCFFQNNVQDTLRDDRSIITLIN